MIVVEGVDNSGKSTLIRALSSVLLHYRVQASEGPPKYKGEMDERVIRYLGEHPDTTIYDRHPCVSQPIYGQMRSHADCISPSLIAQFYSKAPTFIYCDGKNRGMLNHVFNPATDTEQHLREVEKNYLHLLAHYREWAANHAFISYRIGDSIDRVIRVIKFLNAESRL